MRPGIRNIFGLLCLFIGLGLSAPAAVYPASSGRDIWIIELEGPISPATATFVTRGLEQAIEAGAPFCILRLDTPGGLTSSMRSIIKAMLNSPIPVVVYVGPSGAGAASAGVMITVAANVAAMAPGTNIGAAHPVMAGGRDIGETMSEKVLNDMASYARGIAERRGRNGQWVEKAIRESVSITAEEALKENVIDFIAVDMDDLIKSLDGRTVTLPGGQVTLKTVGLEKVFLKPGFRDKVLGTISDPNIAWILMLIGMAGLFFELTHPGSILPGVIGAISLILAFYAFQTLPVNYAGLLLIGLAIIFFIAEVKISSYGVLSIGGIISMLIGSIMLFKDASVALSLMIPSVLLISFFFVVVAGLAFKAHQTRPRGGAEGLIGETGQANEPIDPEGLVFVHGEVWRAVSDERIGTGDKIEVVGMEGLVLKVRKFVNKP